MERPMSEHTPTPWRMDPTLHDIYADNVPKGPMKVADIRGWGYLTGKGHGALGLSYDEGVAVQAANAAFIVKAVNNHKPMDKLLAEAADFLNVSPTMEGMDLGSKITQFRLAMQKASSASVGNVRSPND